MKYDIIINEYGSKFYYKSNTRILHREDGPAVEWAGGNKEWWQNNLLHRDGGPAVEYFDIIAIQYWYRNGKYHRLDGPAVDDKYYRRFFIDGIEYLEKDYWFIVKNNLYVLL